MTKTPNAALFTRRSAAGKTALGDTNAELSMPPVNPRRERMDDPHDTGDARVQQTVPVQARTSDRVARRKGDKEKDTVITITVRPGTEAALLPLLEDLKLLGGWGASRAVIIDDFSDHPEKDGDGRHYFDGDGADQIYDIEVTKGRSEDRTTQPDADPVDGDYENHRDAGCGAIGDLMEEQKAELFQRRAALRQIVLRPGMKLYHGTSAPFPEQDEDLDAPAWVSDSWEVAHYFTNWHGAQANLRVIEYRLKTPVKVWKITNRQDLDRLAQRYLGTQAGESFDHYELAEALDGGWIIPKNYPTGDDILLSDPSVLEYVATHPVNQRKKADVQMHRTPPVGAPRPDQRTHLDEDLKEEMDPKTEDPDLVRHTRSAGRLFP